MIPLLLGPVVHFAAVAVLQATIFALLLLRLRQEPCFMTEVPLYVGVVAPAALVVVAVVVTVLLAPILVVLVFASASRACARSTVRCCFCCFSRSLRSYICCVSVCVCVGSPILCLQYLGLSFELSFLCLQHLCLGFELLLELLYLSCCA